jgi:hypothetical protein
VNEYVLGGEEYRAFGVGVPDTIKEFLNLSDVNFQGQHDPAFWLSDTAGQVSRNLNDIVNLGVIDGTLRAINRQSQDSKLAAAHAEKLLVAAKEEEDGLEWVVEADKELERLQYWSGEIERLEGDIRDLNQIMEEVTKHKREQILASREADDGEHLLESYAALVIVRDRLEGLESTIAQIEECEGIEVPDISGLTGCVEGYNRLTKRIAELDELMVEIKKGDEEVVRLRAWHALAEEQFDKEMGDMCPLCGSSLNEQT